jgi:hypothetical protein
MEFCDMNCAYAEWPENEGLDGSASCRTFQAIFCRKKARLVYKNGPCLEKENRPAAKSVRGAKKKRND